ncbi:hypothetical protein, partial [Streptomyces katsurahamanus]|uniref:hypothetical protein n=1 Tax=Streptomyces katsurahamanus TaxID=2577098 RepID=UPI001E58A1F3
MLGAGAGLTGVTAGEPASLVRAIAGRYAAERGRTGGTVISVDRMTIIARTLTGAAVWTVA